MARDTFATEAKTECPDCGKDGEPFRHRRSKRYCDDEACPVITYDWGKL